MAAEMNQIRFPLRLRSITAGGAYSAPPDPLAVFKGPTSKVGEKRRGEGKGTRMETLERDRKRREGERRWKEKFGQPKHFGVGSL